MVLAIPALALWVPGGCYALLSATLAAYVIRPYPRALGFSAMMIFAISVATSLAFGSVSEIPVMLVRIFAHQQPAAETSLGTALHASLTLALATLAVAVVLGYDTRRAARGVVSDGVWERQHLRRTQLLRDEARSNPPPLVCS